jgi:hypothetical protein
MALFELPKRAAFADAMGGAKVPTVLIRVGYVQDCGGMLSRIDRYGADSNSKKSALSAL